jgi:glycosyltransferase involved in cell wall biosynthesis
MTEALTRIRILHAAETIKGGVGTYLRDLLPLQRSSLREGNIVAVVPARQVGILQAPAGVEIVTFDDCDDRKVSALRLAKKVRELIVVNQPDILHIHSTFAGIVLRSQLALRSRSFRIVYCPHGWAFDRDMSAIKKFAAALLEKLLSFGCDAIVCISEYERQAGLRSGIDSRKLVLVRNGVPGQCPQTSAAAAWPPGLRRLLFVGRFDRQKGVDVFLQAVAQLQGKVFGVIVGDTVHGGSDITKLPANARSVGWLSPAELETYFRTADVVVVPSRWEGFGLTAAEAMRAGVTVVASRVGGLPEVVEDGVTGLLVPPDDAAALVKVLSDLDDSRLRTMGEAARARFQRHFTMDRVNQQLCDLYQKLLPRPA